VVQVNNGRADIVGAPLELGDFLPERREVVLNGNRYLAWVATNQRYPRHIMAKLDRAAREYNQVIQPLLDIININREDAVEQVSNSPERQEALASQPEAWDRYVSTCVQLLIPNLLESEIELVDLQTLERLLRELGYFTPPREQPQEAAQEQQAPLTGDSSPPDSQGSTQDTTLINN
jgi:hypothetical protein